MLIDVGQSALRVEDRSSNGTMAGDLLLRHRAAEVPYGTPIVVGNYTLYVNPASAAARPASIPRRASACLRPRRRRLVRRPAPAPAAAPPARMPGSPATVVAPRPQTPAAAARAAAPPAARPDGAARPTLPAPPPPDAAAAESEIQLRREIHAKLLENLDLAKMDASKIDDPSMRPRVLTALRRIVKQLDARIAPSVDRDLLIGELADEALGLGPLERFLADPTISEIMVVDPSTIFIEQNGKLVRADARFTPTTSGCVRSSSASSPPWAAASTSPRRWSTPALKDGSRVNAVIKPLALRGSTITIRKFARVPLTLDKLIGFGALTSRWRASSPAA